MTPVLVGRRGDPATPVTRRTLSRMVARRPPQRPRAPNAPLGEPAEFQEAVESLRAARPRPEAAVEEAPAPQRLAPYAVALTADVNAGPDDLADAAAELDGETPAASGRFVLLYDPAGHEAWEGTFRVVTFVRAGLEPELAGDPLLPGVGWAWLSEALDAHGARHLAAGGTVTRVTSEGFGTMAGRPITAEVEVRASWTPEGTRLGSHLEAWCDLLCTAAGLPMPTPDVVSLPGRRGRR